MATGAALSQTIDRDTGTPVPIDHIDATVDLPSGAVAAVSFGAGHLNQDEAASIARREGFTFFDLQACPDGIEEDCAVVTVENARGNAFDYFLSPRECTLRPSGTTVGATTGTSGARRGDFCFGPYQVGFRIRHHLLMNSYEDRWVQNQTLTTQAPGADRWERLWESSTHSWSIGKISSGQERGWSYELRDAEGEVLGTDFFTQPIQASTREGSEATTGELCEARKDSMVARHEEVLTLATEACEFTLPINEVSLGAGLTFTKSYSGCEAVHDVGSARINTAGAAFMEACLVDPETALGQESDAPANSLPPPYLAGVDSNMFASADVTSVCPSEKQATSTWRTTEGRYCTSTVTSACAKHDNGVCVCVATDAVEACTD